VGWGGGGGGGGGAGGCHVLASASFCPACEPAACQCAPTPHPSPPWQATTTSDRGRATLPVTQPATGSGGRSARKGAGTLVADRERHATQVMAPGASKKRRLQIDSERPVRVAPKPTPTASHRDGKSIDSDGSPIKKLKKAQDSESPFGLLDGAPAVATDATAGPSGDLPATTEPAACAAGTSLIGTTATSSE